MAKNLRSMHLTVSLVVPQRGERARQCGRSVGAGRQGAPRHRCWAQGAGRAVQGQGLTRQEKGGPQKEGAHGLCAAQI